MKLIKIPAPDFDLSMTLDYCQVFHWERIGKGFVGTVGDYPICIEQRKNALIAWTNEGKLDGFKPSSLRRVVTNYFALDHPLREICASFPDDPAINAAR